MTPDRRGQGVSHLEWQIIVLERTFPDARGGGCWLGRGYSCGSCLLICSRGGWGGSLLRVPLATLCRSGRSLSRAVHYWNSTCRGGTPETGLLGGRSLLAVTLLGGRLLAPLLGSGLSRSLLIPPLRVGNLLALETSLLRVALGGIRSIRSAVTLLLRG